MSNTKLRHYYSDSLSKLEIIDEVLMQWLNSAIPAIESTDRQSERPTSTQHNRLATPKPDRNQIDSNSTRKNRAHSDSQTDDNSHPNTSNSNLIGMPLSVDLRNAPTHSNATALPNQITSKGHLLSLLPIAVKLACCFSPELRQVANELIRYVIYQVNTFIRLLCNARLLLSNLCFLLYFSCLDLRRFVSSYHRLLRHSNQLEIKNEALEEEVSTPFLFMSEW
jgi:hypothetical protein